MAGDQLIKRNIMSEWDGTIITGAGGVSYEFGGSHLFARPSVSVDYVTLSEDGYTDTGGEGLDLTVEDRDSDEFALNGGVAVGVDFIGNGAQDRNWFRVEAEGGWREVLGGELGATTARFGDGDPFTLDPEQLDGGWYARLRALGGSRIFQFGGEVGAEDRHGNTALSLRGTLRMGF
jgi:hypothetical protein